jgi:hypothetical protein
MTTRRRRGTMLFLITTLISGHGAGAQRATPGGAVLDSAAIQERANFRLMLNGAGTTQHRRSCGSDACGQVRICAKRW